MPERGPVKDRSATKFSSPRASNTSALLQQAKDLASHALPSGSLEQLHLQAMRLLVAELKKRRCAALKPGRAIRPATRQQRQRVEANASRQRVEANASRQRVEAELPRAGSRAALPP